MFAIHKSPFSIGHPFHRFGHVSKHAKVPYDVMPFVNKLTSSKWNHFYDILPKSRHQYDFFNPYSFVIPNFIPKSPYSLYQKQVQDTKDFHGNPKVSGIKPNSKPNVLFMEGIKEQSPHENQFLFKENSLKPTKTTVEAGPKPNINRDILAIEIVKAGNESPLQEPKDVKPMNDIDIFSVVSVHAKDKPTPNGAHTHVDNSLVDNIVPNTRDIVDILTVDTNTQITDSPFPDAGLEAPLVDINAVNQNIQAVPAITSVVAPAENVNVAVTIGDIPGFVVDGGAGSGTLSDQVYTVPSTSLSVVTDVLNLNDVVVSPAGSNEFVTTNLDFDLTSNVNPSLISTGGPNFELSGAGGFGNFETNNDLTNLDVRSDILVAGNGGTDLEANMVTSVNGDQAVFGNIATAAVQPTNSVISEITLNAEVIPGGDSGTIHTRLTGASDADESNPNIGSVVFVRPRQFLMNIEPFGPGPYGQCRVPSRVVCGVRFGWEHVSGMAEWCQRNCVVYMYSSYCDDDRCQCQCM